MMWREIEGDVSDGREELIGLYAESGLAALLAAVDELSREADPDEKGYAVLDPAGRRVAGDLPVEAAPQGGFDVLPPDKDPDETFLALGTPLGDGHALVVASGTEDVHDIRENALVGGLWSVGISVPLALLGGFFLSLMVLRRIAVITDATERIRAGNLAERVALRGTGDEFDRLAGHINRMLDSIAELTESMRQVSSDIAHDLRTPLGRLKQRLERVRARAGDRAELEAGIDRALAEVDSVLATFDALLRIGQIEAGTRRVAFRQHDLSAMFHELAEIYGPVAADSGRSLTHHIEPNLTVRGDRALLVQLMSNLIENAVQHTPVETVVQLGLARADGAMLALVSDNGLGIPPEEREKVFQRFYRLDKSRQRGGSGLGLDIVQAIARLHGITVSLHDNQPGLRVELRIPV
jgi:signal transduction histidine kinase